MRALRFLLVLAFAAIIPVPAAAQAPDETEAEALAERYAPLVVVRDYPQLCGDGEAYRPTAVTDILDRPGVVLREADGTVTDAPAVADVATASPGAHIDTPGQPLSPGCDYAQWAAQASADTPPTLYARTATDLRYPGEFVLQYWFYWIYNDWNDRHEGDWEMVQLRFPAAGADPVQVAFAQHEGSEVADWDDPKLRRQGDRIVVYPAEGSHAAFFSQSRWFGKSAASGFGCDDTSVSPSIGGVVLDPEIVLLPAEPQAGDPEFGWLAFEGRWGQQAPSFNNGPTGPNTKDQWADPITWQVDEGRDGAVAIPPVPGPGVTAFCNVTAAGSLLFMELLERPALVVLVLLVLIAAVVLLIRATTWRGADITSYDRERTSGQILGAALRIWLRRPMVFLTIGTVFLAGSLAANALSRAILGLRGSDDIADLRGATAWLPAAASAVASIAIHGTVVVITVAAAMAVVGRQHREVGPVAAVRRSIAPPWTAIVLAGSYAALAVLSSTVVLLPIALWLASRWASAGPAAMVEGLRPRQALQRSTALTRRKALRTLALTGLMYLLAVAPGALLGAVLLLLVDWPFAVINALVVLCEAVTLPVFGIALTLQFYDLRAERVRDGEPQTVPV